MRTVPVCILLQLSSPHLPTKKMFVISALGRWAPKFSTSAQPTWRTGIPRTTVLRRFAALAGPIARAGLAFCWSCRQQNRHRLQTWESRTEDWREVGFSGALTPTDLSRCTTSRHCCAILSRCGLRYALLLHRVPLAEATPASSCEFAVLPMRYACQVAVRWPLRRPL